MEKITQMAMVLAVALPAVAAEPQPAPVPRAVQVFPPAAGLAKDHPRLLLRPKEAAHAVSLEQLKNIPRDAEFGQMLDQLRKCGGAAPSALAWLLTGE